MPIPGQLELFDPRVSRSGPPAVAVRTSIAASEAIREMAPTLRGRVYGGIVEAGQAGATRQELADRLEMRLQTVCGRANELLRMGLIYQTAEARDGRKVLRARREV